MKHLKGLIIIMAAVLVACPNGNRGNGSKEDGFDFEELQARRTA